MTDKITIERETLERAVVALEYAYSADDEMVQESIKFLRAALAAQPADAQPTGQSPCARHCEAPAFEGEIRRLKRELQTQAERIRVLREALEVATNWLSDDRHPIGWTVDRLRAALEATR